MALQPLVGPWPLLQFRNHFYTDGITPWTSFQPVARPLPTHRTQTQCKRIHRHPCPWVGFEPTIPASERAKTLHALDLTATVTGPETNIRLLKFKLLHHITFVIYMFLSVFFLPTSYVKDNSKYLSQLFIISFAFSFISGTWPAGNFVFSSIVICQSPSLTFLGCRI
jgi:hypothetical protein